MRCPNCQKTILDNIKKCPYCGHDTTKKTNVADMFENPVNPLGNVQNKGAIPQAEHHEAVHNEIKKRHWQRWFLYGLIIVIFVSLIGLVVKMNNDNIKLFASNQTFSQDIEKKKTEIEDKNRLVTQAEDALKKTQDELNVKADQYKKDIEAQAGTVKDLEQCKIQLTASDANIYNLILTLGTGIARKDLARIPIAEANINNGVDTDQDGLSDEVEIAVGSDKDKADTDGDSYNDRDELLRSFDPLKANASMPIDINYSNQQKGRIVISVEGNKEAWYVNPGDAKRYFLGHPGDAYKAMRSVEYWTKSYSKQ
jgi:hypothetical protein